MRPCRHSDHRTGCHWCDLYRTNADYRALWDAPADAPPPVAGAGARKRCGWCGAMKKWVWSVVEDGRTVASGAEATEAEARAELAAF